MTSLRRFAPILALVGVLAGSAWAGAQSAQPPEQLDEFIPIDQLPQQEQIPAANLLVPAYAFVWLAVLVYVGSIAKRIGGVEREIQRLESDMKARK
jgi:CcmD family protein